MRPLTLVILGAGAFVAAQAGLLGKQAQSWAGDVHVGLAPLKSLTGTPLVPCPSASELAAKLGVSSWRVSQAMAKTGKDGCSLGLADLAGIPEVPSVFTGLGTGGVPSVPNPAGPAATWANPTGGSNTWGNLTNSQIQASFLASNGNDPAKAAAAWQKEHDAQVAANGF